MQQDRDQQAVYEWALTVVGLAIIGVGCIIVWWSVVNAQ